MGLTIALALLSLMWCTLFTFILIFILVVIIGCIDIDIGIDISISHSWNLNIVVKNMDPIFTLCLLAFACVALLIFLCSFIFHCLIGILECIVIRVPSPKIDEIWISIVFHIVVGGYLQQYE